VILPGFIDMHGDMIEMEIEPRSNADFPMKVSAGPLDPRLAASGVTTAYAGVSFSRSANAGDHRSFEHTSAIIRALKENIQELLVDHRIHARVDMTYTDAIAALEGLLEMGAVDLVLVMDHTPGQGHYRDIEKLIAYRMRDGKSEEQARREIETRLENAVSAEPMRCTICKSAHSGVIRPVIPI
jgi:alpha-D-ribose 1-methylphosphonate 5-triphosphate diphosphatase